MRDGLTDGRTVGRTAGRFIILNFFFKITWKCGDETQRASCLKSGSRTLANSAGSITSKISSSSLRNITSFGLWTFGQNLSKPEGGKNDEPGRLFDAQRSDCKTIIRESISRRIERSVSDASFRLSPMSDLVLLYFFFHGWQLTNGWEERFQNIVIITTS